MENKPSLIRRGRFELKYRGTECLNCGHILDKSDKYCPNCSQMNSTKKVTLRDFFDEFFSNLVNYDSKLLKTLYALLIKPGTITKDYIKGKRITYTNPFRFLLSLAFLYFLMFTYNSRFSEIDRRFGDMDKKMEESDGFSIKFDTSGITTDNKEENEASQEVVVPLDSISKDNPKIAQTLKDLDSIGVFNPKKMKAVNDSLILSNPAKYYDSIRLLDSPWARPGAKLDIFALLIRKDSISTFQDAVERYQIEDQRRNQMPFNASASLLRVVRSPGSFINATIGKLPFVIFFFLPVFTAFIWLVYIRKNYTYTDHLIFSFHNQSLLFILLILSLLIDSIFSTTSAGWFLLIFGFYLYKAMRKFYGQGRLKTIIKYLFLNTVFFVLATITAVVLFTGSAFTY
nr:DUF3667 domain-containing protein [uncultured Allomuricauda sp.]